MRNAQAYRHELWFDPGTILIEEGEDVVKSLLDFQEMTAAYQLRHQVFCRELGWVPAQEGGLEIDEYDRFAIPFGILDRQGGVKGYLRAVRGDQGFMIEREFSQMVDKSHPIRKVADTVEISRLCVVPGERGRPSGEYPVFMVLTKGLYRWCLQNGVRYLYLVVEQRVHRLLSASGLPSRLIGEPQVMPDGVTALAALLDWREFETMNALKRPRLLEWFSEGQSIPRRRQWQRRGLGLPRRVSA